jgi:RNA polymerase primary sigma factor
MNRADQRGFVTFEDVLELIEDEGEDVAAIEAILDELDELGIELRQEDSEDTHNSTIEEDFEPEEARDPGVGDIEAVSADDPVGLYFRQMAQEPLLTAQEEISLAKRIEIGKEAQEILEGLDKMGLVELLSHIGLLACEEEKLILQTEVKDFAGKTVLSSGIVQEDVLMVHSSILQAAVDIEKPRLHEKLYHLVKDGQAAREHLGRANTRLVVSIAKRYMGQGLPFPDLIQEGNVGLMRAVDKYDYKRGNRFSTYATWWIRQAITRALAQKTRTIRIPLHMTERIRQMYRTAQVLEQKLGRRPTPEEIAFEMDLPPENIRSMMDASQHAIALERPVGDDGDSEFGDFIEDQDTPSPVESATQHLLQETIEEVLSELTPRQSHILRLRFGLGGGEPHTLEEIANKFGLSRERIRQLEKEALRRLRHPRLAHNLRDYLT